MRAFALIGCLALASPAAAADLVVASGGGVVPAPETLEWVLHVQPRIGRDVVVPVDGRGVATIEWRHPVEMRARTLSGEPLSPVERESARATALACERGAPRGVTERVELGGTYVVELDCVWLQGLE